MTSPSKSVGPYLIESELGRGGMGAVYRVRHAQTGGVYALKVTFAQVDDERARRRFARFQREVEVLARMGGHPGIVRIHACGVDARGRPWCAMEMIDGDPLSRHLASGPLPPEDSARLVIAVARAIEHVHAHDVVHRDLKPENIIIERSTGRPCVVDFGLAYDAFSDELTRTGELLGTPAFMAPEQVARTHSESGAGSASNDGAESEGDSSRASQIGPTTDVYGIGAVLYATLTGRPPFAGSSFMEILLRLTHARPEDPRHSHPEIPADLEAVCLRAIEKEPDRRYPSAAALADDLERWLAGEPTEARPLGPIARLVRRGLPTEARRRRRRVLAIAAALGLVAVVAGAGALLARAAGEQRRRNARIGAARAELDEAFARACDGDGEALDRSDRLARELASGGQQDRVLLERRRVIEALLKIAGGDEIAVRTLPIEQSPWREHRAAIVRTLVASGQTRALGILLGREPALLTQEGLAESVADAIAHDRMAPSGELALATVDALERAAQDAEGPEAVRNADLRAGVLTRLIEAILTDPRGDPGDLLPLLRRLIPAVESGALPRPLSAAAVERLVELSTAGAEQLGLDGVRGLGLLVESAFVLLPHDDPRANRIIVGLQEELSAGLVSDDAMTRLHVFELALILNRVGRLPVRVRDLVAIAPSDDELVQRIEAIGARGAATFELADLEMIRHLATARQVDGLPRDPGAWSEDDAYARVSLSEPQWSIIRAILARERAREDVPGWVLIALASTFGRGLLTLDPPERRVARDELAERSLAVLPPAWFERDVEAMPAPPAESERLRPHRRAVDHLSWLAWIRTKARPVEQRRLGVYTALTRWLVHGSGRFDSALAVEVALDALTHADPERASRPQFLSPDSTNAIGLGHVAATATDQAARLARRGECPRADACELAPRFLALADVIDRVFPNMAHSVRIRSAVALRHGRPDEAIEIVTRGLEPFGGLGDPRDDIWRCWLWKAEALGAAGRLDEARAVLESSVELFDGYAYDERADVWLRLGDPERAEEDRERARASYR